MNQEEKRKQLLGIISQMNGVTLRFCVTFQKLDVDVDVFSLWPFYQNI